MATFKLHQVKDNGMAEYRQDGNTATVRFGKTFWKDGATHPQELTISLVDGTSIQDLVNPPNERKGSGLSEEDKAAKAEAKAKAKAERDAERTKAREARKAERDAERAKRDEERAKAREERKAERDAERAAKEAAGESVEEPVAAEM